MRRTRILPWALALLMGACQQGSPAGSDPGTPLQPTTHCYILVTRGAPEMHGTSLVPGPVDSLDIRMDVLGELVNGVYNWLPQEKDAMTGTFTGTLENGLVTALYSYTAEGMTARQEVLFKLEEDGLRAGHGELVEREEVWVFKDRSLAEFGDLVPEVDCP